MSRKPRQKEKHTPTITDNNNSSASHFQAFAYPEDPFPPRLLPIPSAGTRNGTQPLQQEGLLPSSQISLWWPEQPKIKPLPPLPPHVRTLLIDHDKTTTSHQHSTMSTPIQSQTEVFLSPSTTTTSNANNNNNNNIRQLRTRSSQYPNSEESCSSPKLSLNSSEEGSTTVASSIEYSADVKPLVPAPSLLPSPASVKISTVTTLDISHTKPGSSLPKWLSEYKNLRHLKIEHAALQIIDDDLARNLSHLQTLRLAHNSIQMLPENLACLYPNLRILDVEDNPCFSNLPTDILIEYCEPSLSSTAAASALGNSDPTTPQNPPTHQRKRSKVGQRMLSPFVGLSKSKSLSNLRLASSSSKESSSSMRASPSPPSVYNGYHSSNLSSPLTPTGGDIDRKRKTVVLLSFLRDLYETRQGRLAKNPHHNLFKGGNDRDGLGIRLQQDDNNTIDCGLDDLHLSPSIKPQKMKNILQELATTEVSYVSGLQEVHSIYCGHARVTGGGPSTRERRPVFGQLNSLLRFHRDILLPLVESAADSIRDTNDEYAIEEAVEIVGRAFLDHYSSLQLYVDYVEGYTEAKEIVDIWSSNAGGQYRDWITACRAHPKHSQIDLQSYLLLPIQRIPRYVLLLKPLCNVRLSMAEANDKIADLASDMNVRGRQVDSKRRQYALNSLYLPLLAAGSRGGRKHADGAGSESNSTRLNLLAPGRTLRADVVVDGTYKALIDVGQLDYRHQHQPNAQAMAKTKGYYEQKSINGGRYHLISCNDLFLMVDITHSKLVIECEPHEVKITKEWSDADQPHQSVTASRGLRIVHLHNPERQRATVWHFEASDKSANINDLISRN